MSINLDNLDEEIRKKIMNLQNLQRSLEVITQQKIQLESTLRETELAIEELEKAEADTTVYKSIGGILIKSEKDKLLDEKKSRKVTLEMRIKTLGQKEERTRGSLQKLQQSIQAELQAGGGVPGA